MLPAHHRPLPVVRLYHLAQTALAAYALPEMQITPLRLTNNAVFRVDTRRGAVWAPAYILRIHRPSYRSPAQTCAELHYLQSLQRITTVAVPEPVLTQTGDLITLLADDNGAAVCQCDLLRWLPGWVRRSGSGLGRRSAYRLGSTLGQLHLHAQRFTPPAAFDLPCWDADALLSDASPFQPGSLEEFLAPEDDALVRELHERVHAVFQALGQTAEQFGVIHADFILGNCLFYRNTPQVVDFDDCGWGYFLYDLCPLLGNFRDYPHYPAQTGHLSGISQCTPRAGRVRDLYPVAYWAIC